MGGSGSTRWRNHRKKEVVESCQVLDVDKMGVKHLCQNPLLEGRGENAYFSIIYKLKLSVNQEILCIEGCWQNQVDSCQIKLEATRQYFGDLRWWFKCPVTKGGVTCGRRVKKLYLHPGSTYWGCRQCHHLAYESNQASKVRRVI